MRCNPSRHRCTALLLCGTLTLTACGDDPSQPPSVETVAIQPGAPQLLLGDSVLLSATATDANGRPLTDRTVAWSSQDPSIVRVDGRGMAYAEDVGSTTVTATVDGVSGSAPVSVDPTPVAAIDLGGESVSLVAGLTTQLTADLRDAQGRDLAAYYHVAWSSSDDDVVTVSASGLVTAMGTGTATITASAGTASADIQALVEGAQVGAAGGTVTSADGRARLEIPAGALAAPTVITLRPATAVPDDERVADGSVYTFEPSGLQFQQPARLTIDYGEAAGIDQGAERYLALHRWTDGEWVFATTTPADTLDGTVSGMLSGFSSYGAVLAEVAAALQELGETLDRVLGDAVLQDAVALIYLYAGLAQKEFNGDAAFPVLIAPALEAARLTTCNAYRNALTQANAQTIDSYGEFRTQTSRVLLWEGIVQGLPDAGDCEPPVAFDQVIMKLMAEFADFTIARLAANDLDTDYRKLLDEARLVLLLRGEAAALSLDDVDQRLLDEAQEPLIKRLRASAYAGCRQQREHVYLGDLLETLQFMDQTSYDADDLLRDLQLCGTDFGWTILNDDDDEMASGRLGGGAEPGPGTTEATASGLAKGTLRLDDTLLAFRCAGGTFEQDDVKILLDGTEVHTLPWNSGGNFLMQPVELSFEQMLQAAGIDPAEDGTYQLSITRSSGGCNNSYVSSPAPFTLASLDLTYPAKLDYSEDFEGEVGEEWAGPVGTAPAGERFLGPVAHEQLSLTLDNLPPHEQVTIEFDLYIIGTWNGNDNDAVEMRLGDSPLLTATFSNDSSRSQSYPGPLGFSYPGGTGAVAFGSLGYPLNFGEPEDNDWGDTTYRLIFTVPHTGESLILRLTGSASDPDEEFWGIDNVRVSTK